MTCPRCHGLMLDDPGDKVDRVPPHLRCWNCGNRQDAYIPMAGAEVVTPAPKIMGGTPYRILRYLQYCECAKERQQIAAALGIDVESVSKALVVLRNRGLVERRELTGARGDHGRGTWSVVEG